MTCVRLVGICKYNLTNHDSTQSWFALYMSIYRLFGLPSVTSKSQSFTAAEWANENQNHAINKNTHILTTRGRCFNLLRHY